MTLQRGSDVLPKVAPSVSCGHPVLLWSSFDTFQADVAKSDVLGPRQMPKRAEDAKRGARHALHRSLDLRVQVRREAPRLEFHNWREK